MGTNYYATLDPCECCGRGDDELHIGKSSGGWQFLFAPHPQHGLTTWENWRQFLRARNLKVRDEYGDDVNLDELEALIEQKQGCMNGFNGGERHYGQWNPADHEYLDPDGYRFSKVADFS